MQYFEINDKCPFIEEFMKEERWVDIYGYEGYYQVSNYGRIRSLERIVKCNSGTRVEPSKLLSTKHINNNGYVLIGLGKNGKKKFFQLHKLVLSNFLGCAINKIQINHIDENKQNNRLDNLHYCTAKFNTNYGDRNNKISQKLKVSMVGKKQSEETINKRVSKIIKAVKQLDIQTNEIIKIFHSVKQASLENNIKANTISSCALGKRKTAGGFKWEFV